MGVLCAIICLLSSSLNDFAFKSYTTDNRRSRGFFFMLVGVVVVAIGLFCPVDWSTWRPTLVWTVLVGIFSIVANVFLIRGMELQSGGICSTIYRLNLVPTVLLAWFLLQEKISLLHWLGIACALGAIVCFSSIFGGKNTEEATTKKQARLGIALCVIAALLRAMMGITAKYAIGTCHADQTLITIVTGALWIIGGAFYGICEKGRHTPLSSCAFWGYGVLSGALVWGIIFFMMLSLKYGNASVVLPIAQMSFPVTLLLSVFFLHEKVTWFKLFGILLGVGAILLLNC